jgi:hypothetical protein
MGAAWLRGEGAYLFFYFCIQKEWGLLERGVKERAVKYRIYSTSIPSQICCRRGATARVKAWIARLMYCMLCIW